MVSRRLKVAVVFAGDSSHYPNIKASDLAERDAIYWRCICVALASVKYLGGASVEPLVIGTDDVPEGFKGFIERHGIGFQKLAFSYRPPAGFSGSFVGSLYTLDAIGWFGALAAKDDKILLIDPDCLVNAPLESLSNCLDHVQALVYPLAYPRDQMNNGQSLDGIAEWMNRHALTINPWRLRWLGGEFLGLTGGACQILAPALKKIWQSNLADFLAGRSYLKTEEHMLSVAFAGTPLSLWDGGGFVRRLWTTRSYHNLNRVALALPIWHMPAEKQRGFAHLYQHLARCPDVESARSLLSDRDRLAHCFGFKGRTGLRLLSLAIRTLQLGREIVAGREADFEGNP